MRWRAYLAGFVGCLAPMLVVLIAGLARAWRNGQADPWIWAWPAALVLVPTVFFRARRRWSSALWVGPGIVGMVLIFCGIASTRMPDPVATMGLVLIAVLATGVGLLLRQGRLWVGGGVALMTLALLWHGPTRPVVSQSPSSHSKHPVLAVITGLPLFWTEEGAGLPEPADAPIVTLLRTRFTVRPVDDARVLARSGARVLLLAQPRAMTPEALVAIDGWVRSGGRAVILADPLLRWPSARPIGDRRRPPSVSLIDPLLAHWGIDLGQANSAEIRHFLPDGRLLTMAGMSSVQARCPAPRSGIVIDCAVGRGRVIVLGDADLLDDRLWLADPARPTDPRAWSADTPQLVAQWLGADLPGGRRWFRTGHDVQIALRWALIVGMGWAILGMGLVSRTIRADRGRTKHENKLAKDEKTR